jgi:hypothetical protein
MNTARMLGSSPHTHWEPETPDLENVIMLVGDGGTHTKRRMRGDFGE